MSDKKTRQIKLVISAVGAADNFETNERLDEVHTEVVQVSVDENVSLYRVVRACRRLVCKVKDKI